MQKSYKPSRIIILAVLVLLVLGFYMATLYKMQLYDKSSAASAWLARNTTTQKLAVPAARGDILDRNGEMLVSTRPAYNVALTRDELVNRPDVNQVILKLIQAAVKNNVAYTDTFPMTTGAPFAYLSDMTSTQKSQLKSYLAYFKQLDPNISASDLFNWMKSHYGIDYTTSITDARLIIGVRYEMELRPIMGIPEYLFAEDVGVNFLAILKEQNFPGINIETAAKRVYHTDYAAHLLGYIGAMDSDEYAKYKDQGYSYNAQIGKAGAEQAFEQYLHGTDGTETISKTDDGTVVNDQVIKPAVPGDNVFLSVDIGLQAVCEDSLAAKIDYINSQRTEDERVTGGAVTVEDVRTGQLLACASYPTYDLANLMKNYNDLVKNTSNPLFNRATMGAYNPGSTFKMVTALAGLRSGFINASSTVFDSGVYMKYADTGFHPVCWIYTETGHGHGTENVVTALRDSCNYFFYWVGDNIGIDAISSTASDFGLGAKTGIELPESAGTLATPEYKKTALHEDWYAADNIITAIGQGYNLFTPVQLVNYVSTIANGGTRYSLTMLSDVRSADYSSVVYSPQPKVVGTIKETNYLDTIKQGMRLVASVGTASSVWGRYPIPVAAKTGTVQTETGGNAMLNNGVFVCFAPADNPQIAISLVVEKGTSGSTIMEIARDITDYYFRSQSNQTVSQDNAMVP